MTHVVEDTQGKVRNLPIDQNLKAILLRAGEEAGVDKVCVTSGGQPAKGSPEATRYNRVGSTRHDLGRAADLELWKNGRVLSFTSEADLPTFKTFVTSAARLGAIGFGAGTDYMGAQRIHVGFGLHAGCNTKSVWGAKGQLQAAPTWLRESAQAGWQQLSNKPLSTIGVTTATSLNFRRGPGTEHEKTGSLPTGTEVTVLAAQGDWYQVRTPMGYEGWVHGGYVRLLNTAPAPGTGTTPDQSRAEVEPVLS